MILFITLHLVIFGLVFFILLPFFDNTVFIYLTIAFLVFGLYFCYNLTYKDLLDIVEKGEDLENVCPYCLVKKQYRSLY